MDVKICVSHRLDIDSYVVSSEIITPVLCGAVYDKEHTKSMQGDNQGENISSKRLELGEFTVEYWMWKNIKADYYGLCHYRRYFSFSNVAGYRNGDNHIFELFLDNRVVKKYMMNNDEKIKSLCREYEIIIPEPTDVTKVPIHDAEIKTVKDLWAYKYGKDMPNNMIDIFLSTLKKINFPLYDEAVEYLSTKYHIGYNCFIVSKEIFNEMCELVFNTFSVLESEYKNMDNLNEYPRTLGYLCEIIFGVYMYNAKKNKKYKEIPLIFFGETRKNIPFKEKYKVYAYEYTKRLLKFIVPISIYQKLKIIIKN